MGNRRPASRKQKTKASNPAKFPFSPKPGDSIIFGGQEFIATPAGVRGAYNLDPKPEALKHSDTKYKPPTVEPFIESLARIIDPEPWDAIKDGRDRHPDSMWWLRRAGTRQQAERVALWIWQNRTKLSAYLRARSKAESSKS